MTLQGVVFHWQNGIKDTKVIWTPDKRMVGLT